MKKRGSPVFREEIILNVTAGKDVLDCGGVDHWAFEQKLTTGEWLHAKIHRSAKSCLGIDILDANVEKINQQGKYKFLAANVEELKFDSEFDVVVAGEIIEHLYNPGKFLDSAWRALRPHGYLVITTPNAYSFSAMLYALILRREKCHPEHTCYFSPQTLTYLVERHGFKIEKVYHASSPSQSRWIEFLRKIVIAVNPLLCERVVLTATKTSQHRKYEDKW